MYKLLIADDEPLVQIGLKSLLSRKNPVFEDVEVIGSVSNGRDALKMIAAEHPDIVITDIKMPIMDGLALQKECSQQYGDIPVFIMLTAYDEFGMVREALKYQAVDYLVKIELNVDNLSAALLNAKQRVNAHSKASHLSERSDIDNFRQKLLLRILNRLIPDEKQLQEESAKLELSFAYDRFIVAYACLFPGQSDSSAAGNKDSQTYLSLLNSCIGMSKEILNRHSPCYIATNDPVHFTAIFYFNQDMPVAEIMEKIHEAADNTCTMIQNYFNVALRFGIGTAVANACEIGTSFDEARSAAEQASAGNPIRLFSHIVGTNRRSGKDKLISSIQNYIDENLGGRLQLNEVADAFGLSPAYLSVLFKKSSDVGFSEYVNNRKIDKAEELLLNSDMKIYEVADALGFESAFYFSKVFKKVTGKSPREFIQAKEAGH